MPKPFEVCIGVSIYECRCLSCWEARREKIARQVARIEARLDWALVHEQIRQDNESWAIAFFRARCVWNVENDGHETMRPPRMEAEYGVY